MDTEPKIEQLLYETNPRPGYLPGPVPQIYDDVTGKPATVRGRHGYPGAVLVDADGNPISPATTNKQDDIINALETLATTLGAETTLAAVLQALEGTLDVSGEVDVSGAVDVSSDPDRELGKVTLTGQIRAKAADRPAANTVEIGTTFWAVDTGAVAVSDGTEWRSLGVA